VQTNDSGDVIVRKMVQAEIGADQYKLVLNPRNSLDPDSTLKRDIDEYVKVMEREEYLNRIKENNENYYIGDKDNYDDDDDKDGNNKKKNGENEKVRKKSVDNEQPKVNASAVALKHMNRVNDLNGNKGGEPANKAIVDYSPNNTFSIRFISFFMD
jgi:hypothetical protein